MSVKVEVWGEYACFSRPELKVERMSYDVMTPSAARGILDAIYFHPGMRWHIDRIYVLNPIDFTSIRRNEVTEVISDEKVKAAMKEGSGQLYISAKEDIAQRTSTVLKNPHYVIEAHFTLTDKAAPSDNHGKFSDIMRRRLEKGQCYHQPCFGMREFPAAFRAWQGEAIPTIAETRSLGLMLFDRDYTDPENITSMFFKAELQNGVMQVAGKEVLR